MSTARAAEPTRAEKQTVWTITVPNWHPTRLNQMLGRNRFVVQKLKARDRWHLGLMSVAAGVPLATGKRRVTLRITLGPRQRAGDPDCYWKSLLDGLVHLKLLRNDNRQWVELAPVEFDRGAEKKSVVVLEDLA